MDIIARLPEELRLYVFQHCSHGALAQLSVTSRTMQQLCVEHLYHTLDLSSHNDDKLYPNCYPDHSEVPADYFERKPGPLDTAVWRKQQSLIRTLVKRPEYGAYVRILRWTAVNMPSEMHAEHEKSEHEDPETSGEADAQFFWERPEFSFNNGNDLLWRTWQCFTRVTTVDIGFLIGLREATLPPPLFASATSIRLTGIASHTLVNAILHAVDPSELLVLSMNNLQSFADPEDMPAEISGEATRTTLPGPMQGHLRHLIGRCPKLVSLQLSTVGQYENNEGGWDADAEIARYEEIAFLLRSVTKSLREFTFEQGIPVDKERDRRRGHALARHPTAKQDLRPMDVRFMSKILPVILESPWPKLERMTIRGVGKWSRRVCHNHPSPQALSDPTRKIWPSSSGSFYIEEIVNVAMPDATKEQIRSSVGPHVDLVLETESLRPFWLCNGIWISPTGII